MAAAKITDKKTIAEQTAKMYLDVGAVRFMEDKPFIFTSGWASPVYNDSRWLISFPQVRSAMMDFAVTTIDRDIGRDKFDTVAGGETAGIAFAAWVAERLNLPMQYVRKKAKGFGRGAQIEGKVRIEITVGPDGAVTAVRVIQGLGHGLDEAALEAARGSTFEAGSKCGKPIAMTFTIGMRFSL